MPTPYGLVLFDLDGVLIDSREVMAQSWRAVRERFGVTQEFEEYFALIGRPFPDIMEALGLGARAVDIEPVYMAASLANFESGLQFDGVDDMLLELRDLGLALGVITSKDATRTEAVLRRLPAVFDVVKTPQDVRRGKPAPDALLLAMGELSVDPAASLYVGDMAVDQAAASRAGIDYVHACWGYGLADDELPWTAAERPASVLAIVGGADAD